MSAASLTFLQILPALDRGGAELCAVECSAALVQRGHRSLVLSAGGRLVEHLEAEGGQHITMELGKKTPWTLLKVGRLRKLLMEQAVDLVSVHSRMPAWVAWLAWRGMPQQTRPRLVTTVHGLNSVNWYSKVMTHGEVVVAVSECCREYVLTSYPGTDPNKIITIQRGIDSHEYPFGYQPPTEWHEQWQKNYPQLAGRFLVLIAGRLTRLKGHFDFLQAIQHLKLAGVPVHGLIAGSADPRRQQYADSLHREVERLQLQQEVTFLGHRSDLREVMSVSDAIVSTTHNPPESFGRTILEAVKLGRPAVGYNHGGVAEVLSGVYPAGRVAVGDTIALAERLAAIYRGEVPPPQPTTEFELATQLNLEIELYERLVAERSRRTGDHR
jgi:glycosyltransferase involved in cell wall biosynthesis